MIIDAGTQMIPAPTKGIKAKKAMNNPQNSGEEIPKIKKPIAMKIKKELTNISFFDCFNMNTAGHVKNDIHIKLKEYVPINDNICNEFK